MGPPYGEWRLNPARAFMSLGRQFGFWLVALLALVAFLWLLSAILLPFMPGLVLAYFLVPVADALERLGLPRLAATLVILIVSEPRQAKTLKRVGDWIEKIGE